jgi:hypothetical protein
MSQEATWFKALNQSWSNNRMLDATKSVSLAVVENGLPAVRLAKFHSFFGYGFRTFVDRRSHLFSSLIEMQSACEILWHFPLTKEVYRISSCRCDVSTEEEVMEVW